MADYLLLFLAILYAVAAWSICKGRQMSRQIELIIAIPLVLQAVFYFAAIFFEMPHWAVAIGQSLYLIAIILISIIIKREQRQ